ncbi:MAG: hypothetical protein JO026_01865, partial [Patescibacteria group bacterium]|nr:hypothetical protein [Patescibacteria group bacterium]
MKKLLTVLFLFLILSGTGAQTAYAAFDLKCVTDPVECLPGPETVKLGISCAVNPILCLPKVASVGVNAAGNAISSTLLGLVTQAVTVFVQLAIGLLLFFGLILNYIINTLVVHMGDFVNSASSSGIQVAWRTVRDLVNIGLIGAMVATAIGTILQNSLQAGKTLSRILIAALLVNFSYFFAGAIIDSSNYLATQFYVHYACDSVVSLDPVQQWQVNDSYIQSLDPIQQAQYLLSGAHPPRANLQDCDKNGLAGKFQEILNIQGLSSQGDWALLGNIFMTANFNVMTEAAGKELLGHILFLIFVLAVCFVYLAIISLLIGRFVTLVFLLITSPLGIAGGAIPWIGQYSKQWWEAMVSQAFFAPLFFLLIGFSLTIIKGFKGTIVFRTLSLQDGALANYVGLILNMIIAIAFIFMALQVSRQMSKAGGSYVEVFYKGADALAGWMPKAYSRGLRFAGANIVRNTIGRAADKANISYEEWAGKNKDKWYMAKVMRPLGWDQGIQGSLKGVRDFKPFGFESFKTKKDEYIKRETELSEVQRAEEQKEQLLGHSTVKEQKRLSELLETARKRDLTPEEKNEFDKLVGKLTPDSQKRFNELKKKSDEGGTQSAEETKRFNDLKGKRRLTDDEQTELDKLSQKLTPQEKDELDKIEEKMHKVGSLQRLAIMEERYSHEIRLAERQTKKDERTGKERLETWEEYWVRQKARGDLGVQQLRDENGKLIEGEAGREDLDIYRDRLDKMQIGDRTRLDDKGNYIKDYHLAPLREARGEVEDVFTTLPGDFLKNEYYKNNDFIIALARALPEEKWLGIVRDTSIRRDIKNKMWVARRGEWARMIKSTRDDVDAKILEKGSPEYARRLLVPYNYAAKYISPEEYKEMILSNAAFADDETTFEDLRNAKYRDELWAGSTSGLFRAVKSSGILGRTSTRLANNSKRGSFDETRDMQHGVYLAMGFKGGENGDGDFVPYIAGDVQLDAELNAYKWAARTQAAMEEFLARNTERADAVSGKVLETKPHTVRNEISGETTI